MGLPKTVPAYETSGHHNPEVLEGLRTKAALQEDEDRLHEVTGADSITSSESSFPTLARAHCTTASENSWILGSSRIWFEDVGRDKDTVTRAKNDSCEQVSEVEVGVSTTPRGFAVEANGGRGVEASR